MSESASGPTSDILASIARKGFEAFAGPSLLVSESFVVRKEEGLELIEVLEQCSPAAIDLPSALVPNGVALVEFDESPGDVGAYLGGRCVGVYAGASLYVDDAYRGRGIGPALCIAAAVTRGGSVLNGWASQGYCRAGISAHKKAFREICEYAAIKRRFLPPGKARGEPGPEREPDL